VTAWSVVIFKPGSRCHGGETLMNRDISTHVISDGFEAYTRIRSTCRKDLKGGVTCELVRPVVVMCNVLI
jgi:hypothetical protein